MSRPIPGEPYKHEVWLTVDLRGVPVARRESVRLRLRRISGWSTCLSGGTRDTYTYTYVVGRENSALTRARRILASEGATGPYLDSFVGWRLELNFPGPIESRKFAPMARAICEIEEVLDAYAIGRLAGVRVDFRGEPSVQTLDRVRSLAAPCMAP